MGLFKKYSCFICDSEIKKKPLTIRKSGSSICQHCYSFIGGEAIDLTKLDDKDIMNLYNSRKEKEKITAQLKEADPLRSAEGMYDYAVKNGYLYKDTIFKEAIANFKLIEEALYNDEKIKLVFTGLLGGYTLLGGNYAFTLTNQRFIYAQKIRKYDEIKFIYLDNLNDVTLSGNKIQVDTPKERFTVVTNAENAKLIFERLNTVVKELKLSSIQQNNENISVVSPVDEIKKYKELLDMGILTQEEFDRKKKELFNL